MLIDDLTLFLKELEPDVATIQAFYKNAGFDEKWASLEAQIHTETFWQNPDQAKIQKEHHYISALREEYQALVSSFEENKEMLSLFADQEAELLKLKPDIMSLGKTIKKFKIALLLNEENDDKNCFLSINAGAGGTESQDWASMLLRMYLRFCEREGFSVSILDYQSGEEAGIKSATLYIQKKNATGFLRSEMGIHRLVRISPFDANKRRHTSFAALSITAESEDAKIEVNEKDLRIDTYRAGGAGGQHVNKTDSAVRITHIPTNIVVQCQSERSQLQNRQTAMKMLKAKLVEKQSLERKEKEMSVEKKKIEWGSQIRSYVLHPYKMVKDHRTDFESFNPDAVLDGELMPFIESYLVSQAKG